jgi:hypothetical protein
MEALQPGFRQLLFKVIDDLALPGGRPGDQKQDVKQTILLHCNLPTRTSRKIKFFTTKVTKGTKQNKKRNSLKSIVDIPSLG